MAGSSTRGLPENGGTLIVDMSVIPKENFRQIKKGDCLLMASGKNRVVLSAGGSDSNPALSFKKVNGIGETTYLYHDIKDKIKGIFKCK